MRPGARLLMLTGCVLGMLLAPCARAQVHSAGAVSTEERLKAAYLFKFRHYVEWPAQARPAAGTDYVIGVVGADEIADELIKIAAVREAGTDAVTVRRLRAGDTLEGVHVLFVGRAELGRHPALLAQAQARSILVVSDVQGALARGSMVNFLLRDERIRFEISTDAAEKSGLKLSARLLALAVAVVRERRP